MTETGLRVSAPDNAHKDAIVTITLTLADGELKLIVSPGAK